MDSSASQAPSQPDTVVVLIWLGVYVVAACLLFAGPRHRLRVADAGALLTFIGLAALSTIWSAAPGVTGRRSLALAGTAVVGYALAQRLPPLWIVDAVRRAVLLIAVVSLMLFIARYGPAFDVDHGTLRGVLASKNTLGRVLGLGLLATVAMAALNPRRVRRYAVSAVPMAVALVLSSSAAGLVTGLLALVAFAVVHGARKPEGRWVTACVSLLTLAVATFGVVLLPSGTSVGDVTAVLGRDDTLSGRTEIWSLALDAVGDQPVLGYGYQTFWYPKATPAAEQIKAALHYDVPHAHNGFIDVALELGVVGLLVVLALVVGLLRRGVADARAGYDDRAVLRLLALAFAVVPNIVESNLLEGNTMGTIVIVAAIVARTGPKRAATGGEPNGAATSGAAVVVAPTGRS